MIQVIIHESRLQTIKINVCGFRANGAEYLNESTVDLFVNLVGIGNILVRGYKSIVTFLISLL
jgi:hypothetical protein